MGFTGFAIGIGVAIVAALGARYLFGKATAFDAVVVGIAALFGMLMGSEMITDGTFIDAKSAGPAVDGLLVVPALVLAIVLVVVTEFFVRTDPRRVS
jgi:hypothetical protein